MKLSKTIRVIARSTIFELTSKPPRRKAHIVKKHLRDGTYRTTINKGNIIIITQRKYVDTDEQANDVIKKHQASFTTMVKRSKNFQNLSFTTMQQRFKGRIANPYKGSLRKRTEAQKGAYGRSLTGAMIINQKTKGDLKVMLHNRMVDLQNETIRVAEQHKFSPPVGSRKFKDKRKRERKRNAKKRKHPGNRGKRT